MVEQAKRRRFSAEYKLRIVREADAFGKGDGDVAALLRREGLYSSQFDRADLRREGLYSSGRGRISSWRRQRDEIAKVGMTSRKRGRKAKAEDPRVKELERENARLQRRLARVETMLEIQKKNLRTTGDPPESTRERRERLIVAGRGAGGADWANGGSLRGSGCGSFHVVSQAPAGDAQTEASSSAAPSSRRN